MFGVRGRTVVDAAWEIRTVMRLHQYGLEGFRAEAEKIDVESMEMESSLDANDLDSYYRDINDDYIEFNESLPLLQNYTSFLMLYMLVERALNGTASELLLASKSQLQLKDFGGQGVRRARIVIEKFAGSRNSFDEVSWTRVLFLGEVRNRIVHDLGFFRLPPDDGGIATKIDAEAHLRQETESLADCDARIIMEPNFVTDAAEFLQDFLSKIFQATEELIRKKEISC